MDQAWRELARTVAWQSAVAILGALVLTVWRDKATGFAFFYGALLIVSAGAISARFALRRVASPQESLIAVLASLVWKWLWVLAGLYVAFARWHLPELAVLGGVIAAQAAMLAAGMQSRNPR